MGGDQDSSGADLAALRPCWLQRAMSTESSINGMMSWYVSNSREPLRSVDDRHRDGDGYEMVELWIGVARTYQKQSYL
jgi:hypothetical protein